MIMATQYRDLGFEARRIIRALGGIPSGNAGLCRCPAHDDTRPSLSVRPGRHALLFKCFAGCDTLDVLKALRALGVAPNDAAGTIAPASPPAEDRRAAIAQRLWDAGTRLCCDPALSYLAARGLPGPWPTLRFHPQTPLGSGRSTVFRPALLVPVTADAGLLAVQRCFLDRERPALARDLDEPRRLLGSPGPGAVRLVAAGKRLGLAEGLETACSAMALLEIPVWAALGAERFGRVAIPDCVEELILLPDNDGAGRNGETRARQAYARPGRSLETLWPDAPFNDWNDQLRAGGKGVGRGERIGDLTVRSRPLREYFP